MITFILLYIALTVLIFEPAITIIRIVKNVCKCNKTFSKKLLIVLVCILAFVSLVPITLLMYILMLRTLVAGKKSPKFSDYKQDILY